MNVFSGEENNALEAVVSTASLYISGGLALLLARTYASTQHRNANPARGPTYGMYESANETTTDVNTITPRYAEVASALSMPL